MEHIGVHAMDSIRAEQEIVQFVKAVSEAYAPADIILFGSRARAEHSEHSDYDFIVVSERFRGVRWHERRVALQRLWHVSKDADFIPYTSEELKRKSESSSVVRAALREGKRIRLD